MRLSVAIAIVAGLGVLLSGCQLGRLGLGGPKGGTYPAACPGLGFSARRCTAIVDRAQKDAQLDASSIAGIEIMPPSRDDGVRLGGFVVAQVRFRFGDGSSRTEKVGCTGVGHEDDWSCTNDPHITLSAGIDHDIPCAGEAPNGDPTGCATLPTTPDHATMEAANPLRIVALDIPLGRTGRYEVKVGHATLPNGYLSRREFEVADLRPTTFWITGGIRLDVRSTVAGRPPVGSIYREAFKGPEPVDVFLVFEVTETSPGAVLPIRELVVQ